MPFIGIWDLLIFFPFFFFFFFFWWGGGGTHIFGPFLPKCGIHAPILRTLKFWKPHLAGGGGGGGGVYVCVSGLHCTERDESLRLAWFVSGWQVPLFSDRNNLLHNLQTQHFERGKGWQEMRWPYGGMVGPRMECWLTVGRADRGIRAWMNVRVECGSHGNGEMEMGSKMEQFHWLFNCTYLQTQYPSPCWKRSR